MSNRLKELELKKATLLSQIDLINNEIDIVNQQISIEKKEITVSKEEQKLFLKMKEFDIVNFNGRLWFVKNGNLDTIVKPEYLNALYSLKEKGVIEAVSIK